MSKIVGIPKQAPATIKHININTIIPEEVLIPLIIIINRNDINIKISTINNNTQQYEYIKTNQTKVATNKIKINLIGITI